MTVDGNSKRICGSHFGGLRTGQHVKMVLLNLPAADLAALASRTKGTNPNDHACVNLDRDEMG